MNNKVKTSLIMASLLSSLSGVSSAQEVGSPTIVAPAVINKGNGFEREVTPLLREISRKKTELELRKLDRELERLDEESLKAQMAAEGAMNNPAPAPGGYNPFQAPGQLPTPTAMPATLPAPTANQATNVGSEENPIEATTDIKVLMIYGFDTNLYAKVASGEQGGYSVKEGDILPNGQVVHKVTANYIEVVRGMTKKAKPIIQRIFLSPEVPSVIEGNKKPESRGGSASSVRSSGNPGQESAVSKILAPIASPGSLR